MDIQNHYYGHSAILASYVGLRRPRHIHGLVQHGWTVESPLLSQFGDFSQMPKRARRLVWTHGSRAWTPGPGDGTTAIGAPWCYMDSMLSGVPAPAPSGTVVFPLHGTKLMPVEGDHAGYARQVADRDGPSTVCLHADDLHDPRIVNAWTSVGHRVVSAGQRRDRLFLVRIRTLIDGAERVVSNRLSTSVMYAAAAGREVELYGPEYVLRDPARDPGRAMRQVWPEFYENAEQHVMHEIARRELGADHVRSPEELRRLLGWDRPAITPWLTYWTAGPVRKAATVLGWIERAEGAHKTEAGLSAWNWLRSPLSHLPATLPPGIGPGAPIAEPLTPESVADSHR